MTLIKKSKGIYLDDSCIDLLNDIDTIIFDCDGVLIDITKSYDLAIVKTTQYVLENYSKITNSINVDFKIIDGFKSTGGFNDEVDLAYAAILSLVAAKKLEKDPTEFIFDVIKNSDSNGIITVEKYLQNQTDISEINYHILERIMIIRFIRFLINFSMDLNCTKNYLIKILNFQNLD